LPDSQDVIAALRGIGEGEGLLAKLLAERREDRRRER
jgi:hypothetical protein